MLPVKYKNKNRASIITSEHKTIRVRKQCNNAPAALAGKLDKNQLKRIISLYRLYPLLTIREVCILSGVSYQRFLSSVKGYNSVLYTESKAHRVKIKQQQTPAAVKKKWTWQSKHVHMRFTLPQEELDELYAIERFNNLNASHILRTLVHEAILAEKQRIRISS